MFCRKMCTVQNLQKQNSAIARRVCRAKVCRIILRILCRMCAHRFVHEENFLPVQSTEIVMICVGDFL